MWEKIADICRKIVLLTWDWFVVVSIIFVALPSIQSGYSTQAEGATIPLCQERHIFLVANSTNGSGTSVTYVNSQTGESLVEEFEGRYLPSSEVCGDNYEQCNTSLTAVNENVTLMMFPLDDGIGLVSFVSNSIGSLIVEQKHHLTRSTAEDCVFVYFVQFSANFIGYCVNLSGLGIMYTFTIHVNYQFLGQSFIHPRSNDILTDATYNLAIPSIRTNFILFENEEADCFSVNSLHVLFLHNNVLVDHVYEDTEYISLGSFNSALCTRIERIGECALAFYCEGVVYIVTDIENFHFIPISSGDVSGHVFPCSSDKYVRLINQTLTLHKVASQSVFSNAVSFPHHFETILRGSCQIVGTGFYFIVTLTDGQTFVVNFTDSAYNLLGEGGLPGGAVSSIIDGDIAVITNGTSTLVKNWTLTCNNDPLIVQSGFTFANVHSSTSNLATQCCCPVGGTDVTQATTGTTSSSGLTTSGTTPESSSRGLGQDDKIIVVSVVIIVFVIGIIIFIVLLLYACIPFMKKRKQSNLVSVQESTDQHGGGHIPRSNDHEGVTMPKAGDDGNQSKEEEASAELNQVVESSMNIDGEVGMEMKTIIPSEQCDTQQGRPSENVNEQGQLLVNTNEQGRPPMEGQQQSNTTYLNGDGNATCTTYKSGLPTLDSIADYDGSCVCDNGGHELNPATQLAFATNPSTDLARRPATNGYGATPIPDDISNDAMPIAATTPTGYTSLSRLVLPDRPSIPSDLMNTHNSEPNFNQTSDAHLPNTKPVSATPTNDNTDSVLVGPDSMSQMPKPDSRTVIEKIRERRERQS